MSHMFTQPEEIDHVLIEECANGTDVQQEAKSGSADQQNEPTGFANEIVHSALVDS